MKFWTRSWQWGADGCRSCLSTLAWAKVWPAKPNHKRLKRQSIVWMLDLFQTHNSVQTRQYVPVFWGSSLLNLRCPTRAPLLVLCTSPRWSHNSPHWSLRCSFGTWISRCPSCSKTSSQVVFWLGSVATMRWKQSSHCQLQELKWWAKEKTLPHSPCQAFRPMLDEHHLEMCRLKAGHCSSDSPTLRNSSNHGWPHRSCVHHRWRSTHTWGEEQFQKASDLQHSWKATIDMSTTQKQYFKIDISKWFLIGIKKSPHLKSYNNLIGSTNENVWGSHFTCGFWRWKSGTVAKESPHVISKRLRVGMLSWENIHRFVDLCSDLWGPLEWSYKYAIL